MYSGDDDPEEDVVVASGRIPPPGERGSSDELPSRHGQVLGNVPGARVEVNEMDDGSMVWAVVRGLRRGSTMTQMDDSLHSRESSTVSDMIMQQGPDSPVDPLRLLIRQHAGENNSAGDWERRKERGRAQSVVEIYEADDTTVGALISEL
jgi:hypothetical protein